MSQKTTWLRELFPLAHRYTGCHLLAKKKKKEEVNSNFILSKHLELNWKYRACRRQLKHILLHLGSGLYLEPCHRLDLDQESFIDAGKEKFFIIGYNES